MHKFAKKIADCLKSKVENIGIENFDGQNLDDLKDWTEIIKNLVCYDKDYKIIEAMDKAEEEDKENEKRFIKMLKEEYGMEDEEEARRYYRGQPRSKTTGRFMSRGDGRRRGYEEYPYELPEMYNPIEYFRDMDRPGMSRMYYTDRNYSSGRKENMGENMRNTGGENVKGYSDGYNDGMRDGEIRGRNQSDSRYDKARRGYEEKKKEHKGNTAEDKQEKMRGLEHYMSELTTDIMEMISDATPEERSLLKQKIQILGQKL